LIIVDRKPSRTGTELAEQLYHAEEDGLINWTGCHGHHVGMLNEKSFTDKLRQLQKLHSENVIVTPFQVPGDGVQLGKGWLPRRKFHSQGRDFLRRRKPFTPDFWTQYVSLSEEWRIHVVRTAKQNYKVIRCGIKMPREGERHHPWVRSSNRGWKISYTGGASNLLKAEARKAMRALDLDFGAVDIGLSQVSGAPTVIEVNTCPGLDTGTLDLYIKSIRERCHGDSQM
jgi:hypothetical protein